MTSLQFTNDNDFTEVIRGKQTKHGGHVNNPNQSSYKRQSHDNFLSRTERHHNYGYRVNDQGKSIRHYDGFRLNVIKGSADERNLFSMKDSVQRDGQMYYFFDREDWFLQIHVTLD